MRKFIGGFSTFLDVHTALAAVFYGVIYIIKQAQKMGLKLLFIGCFVIGGTFVLITIEKSGLGFLTFFVKRMHVLI